ncbi:MAG: ABC transporter permease [Phycisphaerae bacterium]
MNATWMLALKDLKLLYRDKMGFFFVLVFPLLYAAFFGTIFSGAGGGGEGSAKLPIALVDEDRSAASAAFVERVRRLPDLDVQVLDRAAAEDRVRRGQRAAFVVVPAGFGAARERMFFGEPPRLQVGADPSRKAEAGMLQGVLMQEMARGMQELFSDPQRMKAQMKVGLDALRTTGDSDAAALVLPLLETFAGDLDRFLTRLPPSRGDGSDGGFRGFTPVEIESVPVARKRRGPQNAYAISFPQGIIWGVMGAAAGFGISLVQERTQGTLRRLRLAPLTRVQVLGGKALACFLTSLCVGVTLIVIARVGFGVQPSSLALLAAGLLSIGVCFVGIMMLLSVLGRTEQSAGGIGWAILTVMAMIGGGMVPIFLMPQWMQQFASISPVKWSILAMEGALWREFTPLMMLTPCAILVSIGAGCFLLGVFVFSRSTESA